MTDESRLRGDLSGRAGVGVVYHHRGTKCLVRLCVSIHSLRHFYAGPIVVLQEGSMHNWLHDFLSSKGVAVQFLGEPTEPVLISKTRLWRVVPFERAMYLDADTLVLGPVDEFLSLIEQNPVVASWFTEWNTNGRIMSQRIREWARVDPQLPEPAIAFGKAVNGGVMGWSRESTLLQAWEDLTRRGMAAGCYARTIDEVACQLLLPQHPHAIAHHTWNTSGAFGTVTGARILHFHGNKHVRTNLACAIWKEAYANLIRHTPFAAYLTESHGDRRLAGFLRSGAEPKCPSPNPSARIGTERYGRTNGFSARRQDLTVVTACDASYAGTLSANLEQWMRTPGLREQEYLVFLVNTELAHPSIQFLKRYANVRMLPWSRPWSQREAALSAFVFGVAAHVDTPFWMKLDADAQARAGHFEWPTYQDHTLTSHHWGYTRVKGDPSATRHWLNVLDDWWQEGPPIFRRDLGVHERHWHKRISSFCSIEKTEFTRRLARRCGTRLPVPSHDTTAWYAATRWGESVCRVNMKRWFRH